MMKKNRGLLALTAAFIVLLAVYLGLRAWNERQDEKAEKESEASEIHVTDTSAEDIVSLKFNVGNGEMEFIKEEGQWYCADDRDFPLVQSYPEDMAEAAGDIQAKRLLKDGDALADYGLDEPAYTIEYEDDAGESVKVLFGDMTGDDYYVTVGDTQEIYTVSSSVTGSFNYTLDDMAQLDDYPSIGSGNLVKEVITENGAATTYDSENEEQSEDIAAIAGGLGALTLTEAADYSVEDEDLAGYGLDEDARITVEVTYTEDEKEQIMTLYIGGTDGDGNRYVMIGDSRIVYLVSEEICENVCNSSAI